MDKNKCTEDKIPIRTIYVGNLSSKITKKDVNNYFLKFGNVTSVAIKRAGSRRAPYVYAFVTFEKSESARDALGLAEHKILSRRIVVNAANSRNQLKRIKVSRDGASERRVSLLDLDDDCLYHLASYLQLNDFFNLSRTCQNLEYRLEPIYASYKKLCIDSLRSLELLKPEILCRVGPHLRHISWLLDYEERHFPELLEQYCVSENVLSIDFVKIIAVPKKRSRTQLRRDITDKIINVISNFSNLRNLNICLMGKLTGKHLDKLSNLQNLNMAFCGNLKPEFFKNLCRKTKLVSLQIEGCRNLDRSSIETLASTQTKLEALSISCLSKRYLLPLATLENLKRLRIVYEIGNCNDFLEELTKHGGAELEMLELIDCWFNQKVERAISSLEKLKVLRFASCKNISSMFFTKLAMEYFFTSHLNSSEGDENILNLIRKSETLKVIAIKSCVEVDTRSLVVSAYDIMKKQERKYPLSLFTSGPCIIDGTLHQKPRLVPQEEFLKLIEKFNYPSPLSALGFIERKYRVYFKRTFLAYVEMLSLFDEIMCYTMK